MVPGGTPRRHSSQRCVFRLGLLQNGNVRVGLLPEREEVPVVRHGPGPITRQRMRSCQFQTRQGAYRAGDQDSPVRKNFPKLRGCLGALASSQISLTPHIDREKRSCKSDEIVALQTELVSLGWPQ